MLNFIYYLTLCDIYRCLLIVCLYLFYVEYKTRTFTAIVEMLRWFAGCQIRNVGVSRLDSAII